MAKSTKEFLKKVLKGLGLYNAARKFYHSFKRVDIKIIDNKIELEQMIQAGIMNQYKIMASLCMGKGVNMPCLIDTGFKVYSQFDEDGILLHIFSLIGFTNRKVVEICCGNGMQYGKFNN